MRIWTWLVLGLALGGCVASKSAGRERFAQLASPVPEAPAFEPEMGADDHYLLGVRREPVFGDPSESSPEREPPPRPQIALGPAGLDALDKIIMGATLRREWPDCEEHHLFPQQEGLRALFLAIGIAVDDWAILVPKDQHREAHRNEGGEYGPGGKWNWDWEQWWTQRRRQRLQTNPDDVFICALQLIREHHLAPYGIPTQYRHGRSISRDLYDVAVPPRSVR